MNRLVLWLLIGIWLSMAVVGLMGVLPLLAELVLGVLWWGGVVLLVVWSIVRAVRRRMRGRRRARAQRLADMEKEGR